MASVVSDDKLKEMKDFSESFEKLTEKNKSYVLGYMTCLANTQDQKIKSETDKQGVSV